MCLLEIKLKCVDRNSQLWDKLVVVKFKVHFFLLFFTYIHENSNLQF